MLRPTNAEETDVVRPFRLIKVETKVEAAYIEVRSRILDGSLKPGSTLNQEALAAELGLSTTPLREALRRLEAENLLMTKAHKDITVAPLTRQELSEVLAIRMELDPYAASLAAKQASEPEVDSIMRLSQTKAPRQTQEEMDLNRAFHRAIYTASGNLLLTQLLDSLWDRTHRYRLAALRRQRYQELVEHEHRDIAQALKLRDSRRVAALVRDHVRSARKLLLHFSQ